MLPRDRFFVKICGITSEDDALMCVAMGADAVGFIFSTSPRQIQVSEAQDIMRRLPPEVEAVGVFRNEAAEHVVRVANAVGLRTVQLHGAETVETVQYVRERLGCVIRGLAATSTRVDEFDRSEADFLLFDGENPGSGETHEWGQLGRRAFKTPIIAAGGLSPYNVSEIARTLPVVGVDVASAVEFAPGQKDPVAVANFIRAARQGRELRDPEVDHFPFSDEDL